MSKTTINKKIADVEGLTFLLVRHCGDGFTESVRALIDGGASVSGMLPVKGKGKDFHAVYGVPLIEACKFDDAGIIRLLLEAGANPDEGEDEELLSPLHVLARNGGSVEAVKLIVAGGADIKLKDASGSTPLGLAIDYDNRAMAEILLSAGESLDRPMSLVSKESHYSYGEDKGITLLMQCVSDRDEVSVKLMLDLGADINIKSGDGSTALHYACNSQAEVSGGLLRNNDSHGVFSLKILQQLLVAGINQDAVNSEGQTARDHMEVWERGKEYWIKAESFLLKMKKSEGSNKLNVSGGPMGL